MTDRCDDDLRCDVAIIGAGTAGLSAERNARSRGAHTLLIDDRFAGTTCATVGCMPSKLLIAAADAAQAVRQANIFGIRTTAPVVEGAAVMQRVQRERDRFAASAKESIAELPLGIRIQGRARFTSTTTLRLDDGREIRARAIVIATGAAPSVPKAFESVSRFTLTNESIFELPELPKSMATIGAGPLGLELAQALCRLGVDTTVFDEAEHFSWIADEKVARDTLEILTQELPIILGVKLDAKAEGEGVRLTWSGRASGSRYFDRLLLAAGRPPALSDLDLKVTGLTLDEHGSPHYDPATMQCGSAPIFIAGDADHERPVLHEASAEGAIAGRNAASYPKVDAMPRFVPLSIMFTDPPVAIVGAKVRSQSADVVIGEASYRDQGRAKVFACNAGIVRLYADAEHGYLTGASMIGPGVEHTAHLVAWAIQQRMTAADMLAMPYYHPTFEEGLKPALRSICRSVKSPLDEAGSIGE